MQLPLAMAALLVEAARADHDIREEELEQLGTLLASGLDLDPHQTRQLVERAHAAVEKSVSLVEFTQPVNAALDQAGKLELVRMLWLVALADRHLDRYEDYLIGKVAELLYVPRGDVLRMKHLAGQQMQPGADSGGTAAALSLRKRSG